MSRVLSFTDAINEALEQEMAVDKRVICLGLGLGDPGEVFGTTSNLQKKFGEERAFDMPTSENAMTGVAIGAALNGSRPVLTHQRFDFSFLALDQLINNAAKWSYMFGGQSSVPLTIRLIVGRGWGQGPTHSQNFQSWFAHVPGLKVVVPTNPHDAKGLLVAAIRDPNPVLYFEHRWLHQSRGEVPEELYEVEIGKSQLLKLGDDLTIVASSYQVIESIHACEALAKAGVNCDLIDIRSVQPLDWEPIMKSVEKTGKLLVVDPSHETGCLGAEIIARVSRERFHALKAAPQLLALADVPTPTSFALTRDYYHGSKEICEVAAAMVGRVESNAARGWEVFLPERNVAHDVPGEWFKGPF